MKCHPEQIADFVDGRLSDAECEHLETHLGQCDRCSQQLAAATAEPPFWDDVRVFLKPTADEVVDDGIDEHRVTEHRVDGEGFADASIHRELQTLLDPTDDPRMLGRFGGYEIAGVIGRGGMGLVFKGWDVSLDRYVAIKVLSPAHGTSPAARARFAREAKAAASVVDDHVVAIFGVDEFKGVPYLVMPYVKTESLQQRIDREAPLGIETSLEIALQIARGLSVAHEQGLVHRDIKPSNILMPSSVSRVQITDFGLARAADDASLTRSGVIAGTPQYMSPEQARGDAVDGRTDQFSLGSVLYAMLTGQPPFRADTSYGILRQITDHPHTPLAQVQPLVPPWMCDVVDRLLSKSPSDRFESSSMLATHLEDCLAHLRQPETTVPPKLDIKRAKRHDRHGWIALAMATLALVSLAIAGVWYVQKNESESKNEAKQNALPTWSYDDRELSRIEREVDDLFQELQLDQ